MEVRTGCGRRKAEILRGHAWVLLGKLNMTLSWDVQATSKAMKTASIATLTMEDEQWSHKFIAESVITGMDKIKVPDTFCVSLPQQGLPGFYIWRAQGGETLAANSLQIARTWQIWCMWWCWEPAGDTKSLPFGMAWRLAKVLSNRQKKKLHWYLKKGKVRG